MDHNVRYLVVHYIIALHVILHGWKNEKTPSAIKHAWTFLLLIRLVLGDLQ